jgi:hypothetical protein
MKTLQIKKIGEWSFIVGVILAILVGLIPDMIDPTTVTPIFASLGVLVGFLNVSKKETTNFLIATIALLAAGSAGLNTFPIFGGFLAVILSNIVAFVAPAAVIVALKSVYMYEIEKKKFLNFFFFNY